MNVVIALLNAIFIAGICYYLWKKESCLRRFYWPALLLKLMAGIAVGLVYKYYYATGDTLAFFRDATILSQLARDHGEIYIRFLWSGNGEYAVANQLIFHEPRSLFFIKTISIINLVTFDNYWISSLYFSCASFFAAWRLTKEIHRAWPQATSGAVISFLFFPSIVFWSSGLIKESLAVMALYILSYVFLLLWNSKKIGIIDWLVALVATWLLWKLKYYYAAVFLSISSTAFLTRFVSRQLLKTSVRWVQSLLWVGIFVLASLLVTFLHPNFYLDRVITVIVQNNNAFNSLSDPSNLIHYMHLEPSAKSLIVNSPIALFSGLFRPGLWEIESWLQFFVAGENMLLLILFIIAVWHGKSIFSTPHWLLVFTVAVYIVILCIFLALSTPNFGTLDRYRVGFLPYFIFLITLHNPVIKFLERSLPYLVR